MLPYKCVFLSIFHRLLFVWLHVAHFKLIQSSNILHLNLYFSYPEVLDKKLEDHVLCWILKAKKLWSVSTLTFNPKYH